MSINPKNGGSECKLLSLGEIRILIDAFMQKQLATFKAGYVRAHEMYKLDKRTHADVSMTYYKGCVACTEFIIAQLHQTSDRKLLKGLAHAIATTTASGEQPICSDTTSSKPVARGNHTGNEG